MGGNRPIVFKLLFCQQLLQTKKKIESGAQIESPGWHSHEGDAFLTFVIIQAIIVPQLLLHNTLKRVLTCQKGRRGL